MKYRHHNPEIFNNITLEASNGCEGANAITEYNNTLYLVCSISQEIHIFDKEGLKLKKIAYLGNSIFPWDIVISSVNSGYISSYNKNNIIAFNPSDLSSPLKEIPLSHLKLEQDQGKKTLPRPQGLALKDNFLYVAITNLTDLGISGGPGYIAVIDTQTDSIVNLIKTNGRNTVDVFSNPNSLNKHIIYFISAGTFGKNGYIGDGVIDVFDTQLNKIIDSIEIPGAPFEMVADKNHFAYISNGKSGSVFKIDTHKNNVVSTIIIDKKYCQLRSDLSLSYISSIIVDERNLYLTEYNSNCLLAFDLKSEQLLYSAKTGDGPDIIILWEQD